MYFYISSRFQLKNRKKQSQGSIFSPEHSALTVPLSALIKPECFMAG